MTASLAKIAVLLNECHEILSASNEEAALVESVRWNEQLVAHTVAGSERHCANIQLTDAIAALDAFRNKQRDEAGLIAWSKPA